MREELLTSIILYICKEYPHKYDLSDARLTKIIYLADWKYALEYEKELTGIKWVFNHYGPYVFDVFRCAQKSNSISIESGLNFYNSPKIIIKAKENAQKPKLDSSVTEILDSMIDKVQKRTWAQFIQLVYSTYPILTQPRYSALDLVALAREYKEKFPQAVGNH
jgi:uncharacterized phage-associated protein